MRRYDKAKAALSEFISEGAEMLAHQPDRPAQFAREFDKAVDLFKPTPKPCPCTPDWRRLAREDFHLRCSVLLLTMAYNGKDGREYVSQEDAVELLHDLQRRSPKEKHRSFSTLYPVWNKRDDPHDPHAWTTRDSLIFHRPQNSEDEEPYLTRENYLSMLVSMILDD